MIEQFADDWELEESTVRGWTVQHRKDEVMLTLAEVFRQLGGIGNGGLTEGGGSRGALAK